MSKTAVFILAFFFFSKGFAQTQSFESFDGTKIAFDITGEGKLILLVHGFISDRTTWDHTPLMRDLLAADYQVVRIDLRGMGESDKPHDSNKFANYAEVKDIMALATYLGFKKYDIIGYSRGSILTAKLLTMDKRVKKAVLGGMGQDFTKPDWDRRKKFGDIFSGLSHLYPDGAETVAIAHARGADTLVLGYLQRHQPVTSVKELSRIKIPVLVISGDQDTDNGSPEILAGMLKKSTLSICDGKHGEAAKTERFSKAVLDFLLVN